MYPSLSSVSKPDLQALIAAIAHAPAEDRLDLNLPPLQSAAEGAAGRFGPAPLLRASQWRRDGRNLYRNQTPFTGAKE